MLLLYYKPSEFRTCKKSIYRSEFFFALKRHFAVDVVVCVWLINENAELNDAISLTPSDLHLTCIFADVHKANRYTGSLHGRRTTVRFLSFLIFYHFLERERKKKSKKNIYWAHRCIQILNLVHIYRCFFLILRSLKWDEERNEDIFLSLYLKDGNRAKRD